MVWIRPHSTATFSWTPPNVAEPSPSAPLVTAMVVSSHIGIDSVEAVDQSLVAPLDPGAGFRMSENEERVIPHRAQHVLAGFVGRDRLGRHGPAGAGRGRRLVRAAKACRTAHGRSMEV